VFLLRNFGFLSDSAQTADSGAVYFSPMSRLSKPDPELLPTHRPRCPNCRTRMITAALSGGPVGFEHRTFECAKCGHAETRVLASDPLQSGAAGWVEGELQRPT
jgi:hypothetical protein